MQETKEHIKARMLKTAARVWGYTEAEAESSFDPLVSMLLSACSAELEKISAEIDASRARVLERLVQLVSPDVLTGPLPAHSIATAVPVDNTATLHENTQFFSRIKLPAFENEAPVLKDIFFAPTASFQISKATVQYMAAGNNMFRVNSAGVKELAATSVNHLPASTLWLGINEPAVSLHNSLFYFYLPGEETALFYHQLPKALWYAGPSSLQHLAGYGNRDICGETFHVESALAYNQQVAGKIKAHTNLFYRRNFITVSDGAGITVNSNQDDDVVSKIFGGAGNLLQQTAVRWISIRFPSVVPERLLQEVVCSLNCFPVVNCRLHETTHRMQEPVSIIPLPTDDTFLDLEEVCNEESQQLKAGDFQQQAGQPGVMLLRNGGIGRFDERDAAAITAYLLQLLHDESAAFHALGNDFMNNEIKQLLQVINKLSQQKSLAGGSRHDPAPYLLVHASPDRQCKHLYVKYWSTNGEEANDIKAGSALQLYKGAHVNSHASLVHATKGGRSKLSATQSVLAYKSALLSKERLVTAEDIKAFCHYQLADKVKKIQVAKGSQIHPDQQQGYVRTIDVHIEVHEKAWQDMAAKSDRLFREANLKLLLEQRSTVGIHYRVCISHAS